MPRLGSGAPTRARRTQRAVTKRTTPRLFVHAALMAVGVVAGLATGRVDLFVYAAPFAAFVLIGLALADDPVIDVESKTDAARVVEGDPIEIVVTLTADRPVWRVDVALVLPHGVRIVDGTAVRALRLEGGVPRRVTLTVVADRWGNHELGAAVVNARDRASLYRYEREVTESTTVRVYPHQHRLRALGHASRTQLVVGDRIERRAAGEGIELADLRLFLPGDRPRDVNWRASARRDELWITQRHPERSTDVVLFVDMFSEEMIVPAVRAAGSLADSYLQARDRVALVGFGGLLQWVRRGHGVRQLYRLLDTLIDSRAFFSYADKPVSLIPPNVLSPGSLVIGITPLEDERTAEALVNLRARGFEVGIVELMPSASSLPATTELDVAAVRLWKLQREHNRDRFRDFGIPVVAWSEHDPLNTTMEALWNAWVGRGAHHHASRAQ
jgi:uncharacterized protein (DUF58 family)